MRAAEAIELAARQLYPQSLVRNVDVLTLATVPFRRCYGEMYLDFVNKAPQVLGFFYRLMDDFHPVGPPTSWDRLRVSLETMSLRRFLPLLHAEPWDIIINTHFLSGEIIASLRRQQKLAVPQVMVTTDFETHHVWITEPCEHYFTATEEAALYLEKQGISPLSTSVVGIPIHPNFAQPRDRAVCLRRHGLKGDRPVVLQLSGGDGVGRIEELHRALLEVEEPMELVVVTAHNTAARKRLEAMPRPRRHRVRILGYTTQMDELMTAADLVVSKPGGLTTSEALACSTPLVVVDPVPGQEERNSDFLLEGGAGVKVNHMATLPFKVTALLRDPDRLAWMQSQARNLARPYAAFEVVQRSLKLLAARPQTRAKATAERIVCPTSDKRPAPRGAVAPQGRLKRMWESSRNWFQLLELGALHVFARLWHHCSSSGTLLPATGPAIIIANHPNYCDPAFLLDANVRPLTFLHARDSFETPVLRQLFARAGSIPVSRNGRDQGSVLTALRRLKHGEALCIFPEGEVTCARRAGDIDKAGAAFLALRSGAPVYPARIVGGPQSGQILRDWLWPSEGVEVILGEPIDLSAYSGRPITHALLAEVTRLFMRRLAEMDPTTADNSPAEEPGHDLLLAGSGGGEVPSSQVS
jgi:processive 1,2-diacylglycerol beta-glucosyltransferase